MPLFPTFPPTAKNAGDADDAAYRAALVSLGIASPVTKESLSLWRERERERERNMMSGDGIESIF